MFYEMDWVGAVLLALGLLVFVVPTLWMIVQVIRGRRVVRDPGGSRDRDLDPGDDRP